MSSNVISIDIGTCNIKVVIGRQQGNNVLIENAFMLKTPNHAFSDGKILDMDLLAKSISEALNASKVKEKKVYFTVESTAIIMRELSLPMVKPEDMRSMIIFEIEQYLPIVLSEYVIEYRIQDEYVEEGVKKCKVSVAALPKSIAEGYLELAKELKLTPVVLDMNPNSAAKLFDAKMQINRKDLSPDETIALIDFGYDYTNFLVASKGHARFSRLIDSGGNDIDINIANSFNLSIQDAEDRKIKEGNLNDSASQFGMEGMLNSTIQSTVGNWISEIERLLQYYASRGSEYRINRIYIYGGNSKLAGLSEYLQASLNLPIHKLEVLGRLKSGKHLKDFDMDYYINAIGAIIRK